MKHTSSRGLFSWMLAVIAVATLCAMFFPAHASAQTAPPDLQLAAAAPEPSAALSWQQALIAVVVPLVVAGVRAVLPSIPKVALPILAAVLGGLGEALASLATGTSSNVLLGLALGLAGVGVREAAKQVKAAASAPLDPTIA